MVLTSALAESPQPPTAPCLHRAETRTEHRRAKESIHMQRQDFEAELERAETAAKTGDSAKARSLLDALPDRWRWTPQVFAIRHRLFTRAQPAFLAKALQPAEAQRLAALLNARKLEAAVPFARSLAAKAPQAASPHEALAIAFNALRRPQMARDAAVEALVRAPERATVYRELALAFFELGETEAMAGPARMAADALPDDPQAQRMGAVSALILGDAETARTGFGRLAELMPHNGAAHRGYAEMHRYESDRDPHLRRMQKLLKTGKATPAEELEFRFALGKAFDDLRQVDKAFAHYAKGNALKKELHGLGAARDVQDAALVRDGFAGLHAPPLAGPARPLPILVVGLPRSGTTLAESILGAHSQVATAGELPFLRQRLLPMLRENRADPDSLAKLRDGYLDILDKHAQGADFVVDKMPMNFVLAGIVARLIPGTRIVAMQRDPQALGWSVYKQCFVRTGNGFAYDLRDIAEIMALYRDMTAFWEECGIALHRLDYTALTETPQDAIPALLDALDLPPESACLDFSGSDRAVATASSLQVRGGIYKGSDAAWRRYETHLEPLTTALRAQALI